jgi:haloacetate dehalogenase
MAAREAIVDAALGKWGSPAAVFPADVRAAYVEALGDPAHVHAIFEDYRAAATLDRGVLKTTYEAGDRVVQIR